jgi:putative redox-active protein with C_GCAxxG_C_C motif
MSKMSHTNPQESTKMSRRWLLCATGASVGLLVGRSLPATAEPPETTRILKRGDKIDLEGKGEEIMQKAHELGYGYEKQHGGCARCTVAALQDAIPFVAVDEGLFRGSTCLDGGATPTETQNCGAFTGSGMVIGYVCGSTRRETFEGDAKLAHQLIHRVYDRFKEEYGTVLCEDVRKGAERDCPEVVGRAAKWVAEVLLSEFTDYAPVERPDKEHAADKTSETAVE